MFDIGWDEMALVALVALIVIGPKDLPHVLRMVGQWTRKARSLAAEFQRGMDDMVREAELQDLRKEVVKIGDTVEWKRRIETTVDPTGDIARALEPPKMDDMPSWANPAPAAKPAEPAAQAAAPSEPPPPELPATAPFDPPRKPPEP